jgi:asparagine synthase (glutamine-hydrolysing)
MPGIVGLITKLPRELAERELLRMVETLRHESSYVTGTWIDESLGIYVGWAARRNSFSDGMPLYNERGDVVLVFSGEDYPDPATARRLQVHRHGIETQGPSYLVGLYEEDPAFPACLNGRFHGLLTDQSRGIAGLFNDRYGMHRIYYHESKESFYFAAEVKAILAVRPELRTLDPRGLGEYLACGCVMENRTLFEGVHVLPPASAWIFRNRSLEHKGAYFDPKEWEEQPVLEPEAYYQELWQVFSLKLPRYFEAREKIGVSLTGGLDTRMIMAWHKTFPGSLPCYSFGGMFRDCQDVLIARRVARACGQPHQVIPVGDEFLSRFANYAERTVYLSDGTSDVTHAPDLYANELAAKIAPIRMTGNYGGEVLRRIRAFKPGMPSINLYRPEILSHIHAARDTYNRIIQVHPLSFSVFRQAPWHHYGLQMLEQTQVSLRSPYLDNDLVRTVFRAPMSALSSNDVSLRLITDGNAALSRIRTDRGLAGAANSRSSAITRGTLEFLFKAEYAYDYGMPQWVAQIDHFFAPLRLERLFLGRHKFYHFRVWYRDALSKYVKEMLLDPKSLSRPYLERDGLETIVRGHLKGDQNFTSEIHKVLTLELFHRLFIDSKAPPTENELAPAIQVHSVVS